MEPNIQEQTDDELVQLFAHGDHQAFEKLVLRYKNSLYQYLKTLVNDEGTAGDLFQEVFISLFKHAADFRAEGKVKSWLFLAARNKAFNYLRDHKNQDSLDQTDEEGNEFLHETLSDGTLPALEQLASEEGAQRIRQVIEQLSPAQRETIYLRQYFAFKEVSEMLGRPLGTVLADFHRAVQKIRVQLQKQEGNEL